MNSVSLLESNRIELVFSMLIYRFMWTGFFSRYSSHGNPFDYVYVEDEAEDVLAENGVSPTACVSFCLRHSWKYFSNCLFDPFQSQIRVQFLIWESSVSSVL